MLFRSNKGGIDNNQAKQFLATGDLDFENKYFIQNAAKIYSRVSKVAPSKEDAEEIVLTSYQLLIKYLKKKDDSIDNINAYWTRIAKNMSNKLHMKSKLDPLFRSVNVEEAFFLGDNDSIIKIETEERMEIVNRCIDALGDRCRKIISLYYLLELSYQQISVELDQKESTIRQWRFRCLRDLRLLTEKAGLNG